MEEFDQLLQMDPNEQIRKDIQSRRALMDRQLAADDLKSALCDRLRKEKFSIPGLPARVANLEYSDPELFKYIQKLEFVQNGIWCAKCNTVKNIGVPKPPDQQDLRPPAADVLRDTSHMVHMAQIGALRQEFLAKIGELERKLTAPSDRAVERRSPDLQFSADDLLED